MTRRNFVQACGAIAAGAGILKSQIQDPSFVKAMEGVLAAVPTANSDPDRPIYHFRPPAQWNNDPNGTLYYKGWHHLFYQLNPFGTTIANQHWGHARSRDLVNWEHLPIAIWPSADKGERAIFSGGAAMAADGKPRLLYTSIGQPQPEQWYMSPKDDDLFYWSKLSTPVLTQANHIAGPISQWRDPFMFREGNSTYMVVGGGSAAGRAQVQLYQATNGELTAWKHLGVVFQSLERENRNFECPNLFKVDGKWVMIVSPNRQCEYWVGDLDVAKVRFTPESHGVLDVGNSYASNISVDDQGRTILWLWGRTLTPPGKGWNGTMTLPRILAIGPDGFLRQRPAKEFESLRGAAKTYPGRALESPLVLDETGDAMEIEAEFSGVGNFGLELRRSAAGNPGVVVSVQRGLLTVGNVTANIGAAERYKLRVFLDKCCIEVYANDGIAAVYNPIQVPREDQGIAVFAQPQPAGRGGFPAGRAGAPAAPPRLEAVRVWPMKAATFNMDRFHV